MARAVAASLALGIVGGLAFVFFILLIIVPFQLYLIIFVGVGFLVGEGTSLSVNRKRGRNLKFVAAGGVLAAIMIVIVFGIVDIFFSTGLLGLLALGAAFYFAVKPF